MDITKAGLIRDESWEVGTLRDKARNTLASRACSLTTHRLGLTGITRFRSLRDILD